MIALGDTDTHMANSRRREKFEPHRYNHQGISLTCQREDRCCFVSNCHIPFRSYTHTAACTLSPN